MLFDLRPQPVFNAPSVIFQTVPYTFYQVVNTRLSPVLLLNATTLHVDLSGKLSRRETAAHQADLWHDHNIMRCVDWLRTASIHQADNRLPAMRLRSLWYPYPSLCILSLVSACN